MTQSASNDAKPRKDWMAALLSLLAPGLGLLYIGRLRDAVLAWLLTWLPPTLFGIIAALADVGLFGAFLMALLWRLVSWAGQAVFAARAVRAMPEGFVAGRFNRWWVYCIFVLLTYGISTAPQHVVAEHLVATWSMGSQGMLPTLIKGEEIIISRRSSDVDGLEVGDLVVFLHPKSDQVYVQRVLAQGGDEISVRGGHVLVNGLQLEREACSSPDYRYTEYDELLRPKWVVAPCWIEKDSKGKTYRIIKNPLVLKEQDTFGPHKIPTGHVFLMGDNRDRTFDSRIWGDLPLSQIRGVPKSIWWSRDPEAGIRRERMGQKL